MPVTSSWVTYPELALWLTFERLCHHVLISTISALHTAEPIDTLPVGGTSWLMPVRTTTALSFASPANIAPAGSGPTTVSSQKKGSVHIG